LSKLSEDQTAIVTTNTYQLKKEGQTLLLNTPVGLA